MRRNTRANIGTSDTGIAMSDHRIDTLRNGYEAFNRGELETVFAAAGPDFELVTAERAPSPGTYHGAAEARRVLADLFEPFEEVSAEVEGFLPASGDRVVALLTMRFRPHGSTAVVENRIAHLWTFRDGDVVRMQVFPERERGLEAAGLDAGSHHAEPSSG